MTESPEWVSFYPKQFNSSMFVEKAGYFDERPQVHTSVTQLLVLIFFIPLSIFYYHSWMLAACLFPFIFFGWGKLYIHLPIRTGIQDCDSAAYGFNYHDNKIWIYIGGGGNFEGGRKWKTITMFWDMTWVRTSTKMKDGSWFTKTNRNKINWNGDDEGSYTWLERNKYTETHPYIDSYDNTEVNATISISEMEWRPLGFKWTSMFAKVRRSIDISFDKEVGKGKRSWKGGTVGCSYELLPNETPYECLKRMERERKF